MGGMMSTQPPMRPHHLTPPRLIAPTSPTLTLPEWLLGDELANEPPERWPKRIPGDPDRVQQLATTLGKTASGIEEQHARLGAIKTETFWQGEAATSFEQKKAALNPLLGKARDRYQQTVAALGRFHPELRDAQRSATQASRDGVDALTDIARLQAAAHQQALLPAAPITRSPATPAPITSSPVAPPRPTPPTGPIEHPIEGSPPRSGAPIQRPVTAGQPPESPALREAYERFAGAMAQMHRAIDSYAEAARRCAHTINAASHDSLSDSAGYTREFAALKEQLLTSIGASSPQMRAQVAKLSGVAGLIAWVPLAAAMAGKRDPNAAKALTADVAGWQQAKTDGTKVVDDFLTLMGRGPATVVAPLAPEKRVPAPDNQSLRDVLTAGPVHTVTAATPTTSDEAGPSLAGLLGGQYGALPVPGLPDPAAGSDATAYVVPLGSPAAVA